MARGTAISARAPRRTRKPRGERSGGGKGVLAEHEQDGNNNTKTQIQIARVKARTTRREGSATIVVK